MIVFTVVALLLILVGVGFFIASMYFYLLTAFHNPALATFFCGLSLLIIAILLLLIVILIKSTLFKFKGPKLTAAVQAKVQAIADDPCAEALHVVQEYPFRSSLIAVGAGFLLGFFPQLRNNLIDGVVTYLKTGSVADSLKTMKSDEE